MRVQRVAALRAAFDAIQKARSKLSDVSVLLDAEDWRGEVSAFTLFFNDSVAREGMLKTARRLEDASVRKQALAQAKLVTARLQSVELSGRKGDRQAVIDGFAEVDALVAAFDGFRP